VGGVVFGLVVWTFESPADTVALAKRLIASISAPYVIDGHRVSVGTSIGIALAPEDGADPELLMKNADAALYRSKARGGGTYQFFKKPFEPADMRERATNPHRIAGRRLRA
jgi:predicted signal transduction protein with EAL and GGDEF domain